MLLFAFLVGLAQRRHRESFGPAVLPAYDHRRRSGDAVWRQDRWAFVVRSLGGLFSVIMHAGCFRGEGLAQRLYRFHLWSIVVPPD